MGDIRQKLFQFLCLIVLGPLFGAIAAADQGHADALVTKPFGQPGHHRGLAGAAESQIADADDRHAHVFNRPLAGIELPIADVHAQAVQLRGAPHQPTQKHRIGPLTASADEVLEVFGFEHGLPGKKSGFSIADVMSRPLSPEGATENSQGREPLVGR